MERINYAVLRFVPDEIKQEVFNVGVIVQVPNNRQVLLNLTDHTDTRLHYNLSDGQLYTYKKFGIMLRQYIKRINGKLIDDITGMSVGDDDYLKSFAQNIDQGFRIDFVQSGITANPSMFTERLFNLQVTQGKTRDPDVIQLLFRKFKDLGVDRRMTRNAEIEGSEIGVTAAFKYVNGAPHYIQPISIQRNGKENLKEGALWSTVLGEVEKSEQQSMFHFVVRKNQLYDEKSLQRVQDMLGQHPSAQVLDFDADLPQLITRVQSDLESHPLQ